MICLCNSSNRIKGIALIQVLLITAILSVLALYLSQTAKQQVKQAQWGNDKAQAQVNLHNAESLLLFELLANKKIKTVESEFSIDENSFSITSKWNFYDVPFMLDETVIKIQDQSGLIQLHYPNKERLERFLLIIEPNPLNVASIIDTLLDWQDIDSIQRQNGAEAERYGGINFIRDGAIPSIDDVNNISVIPDAIKEYIITNSTIYKTGAFSAYNAAPDILKSLVGESAAQQVMSLRENNSITTDKFKEITGIKEDDTTYFYTSNYLRIDLHSMIGKSSANKQIYLQLNPYAEGQDKPFNVFLSRG